MTPTKLQEGIAGILEPQLKVQAAWRTRKNSEVIGEMQQLSDDEIASVLIARLMREVQNFVANSPIAEGTSADEIWSRFLETLNNRQDFRA